MLQYDPCIRVSRLAGCTLCVYNSTKRYAYRVDLNIDVAITSYSTRIAGFLFVVLYSLEYGTPVRYGSTGMYYSYGTVPALFTIRFGRAETVPVLVRARGILFEIQYGTRTVQYSTVAYSYTSTVQAREGPEYRTRRYGTGTVVV